MTIKERIEEILRDKILFIGNEIPEIFTTDKRDKQLYLGYPQQFIDQLLNLMKQEMKKIVPKKNIIKKVGEENSSRIYFEMGENSTIEEMLSSIDKIS